MRVATVGLLVADVMAPISGMPRRGELVRVPSITMHNGGNAMTAAINLHTLGVDTELIGKVGKDAFGEFLLKRLSDYGVSAKGVKLDPEAQTSVSLVLLDGGERSFLHTVGANATLSFEDIDFSVIESADAVFLTGAFLMDSLDGEGTKRLFKKCKELGKTTFLDVCFDAKDRWGELIYPALPYVDYFMPSIDEAKRIAGFDGTPDEIAEEFSRHGGHNTVIKLGSRGSYLRLEGEEAGRIYPSERVENPIDTTGAGDSFCSGFIAAFARGFEPSECMRYANLAGSLCVQEMGATAWARPFNELEQKELEQKKQNERIRAEESEEKI